MPVSRVFTVATRCINFVLGIDPILSYVQDHQRNPVQLESTEC